MEIRVYEEIPNDSAGGRSPAYDAFCGISPLTGTIFAPTYLGGISGDEPSGGRRYHSGNCGTRRICGTGRGMTLEEKLAYIFDPGQMAVDFVTGVLIGEAVDGIANKLPTSVFRGKEDLVTLQTGERQIDYNTYLKRLETIDIEYESIHADKTDILKIVQNTGIPEWKIRRIKEHVFFNEHILDAGVKRFDADPEIADAWYRLTNGDHTQNDIDLLNHEYFESKFESFYRTDYRTAHKKTEESRRIWDPYKEDK